MGGKGREITDFDLNGILRLRFQDGIIPSLTDEYSYWKVEGMQGEPDLEVAVGTVTPDPIRVSKDWAIVKEGYQFRYDRGAFEFRPGKVIAEGAIDPNLLDTKMIMPSAMQILLRRNWCIAHASAATFEGRTMIFPAMKMTGKTNVLLELLSRGAGYMGDDHVLVGADGDMLLFPRWVHLLEHNLSLFPELIPRIWPDEGSRRWNERRLRKYRQGLHMSGNNELSRYLKAHYQSINYFDIRVRPEQLFPRTAIEKAGKVTHAFFLTRRAGKVKVSKSSPSRLANLTAAASQIENGRVHETLHRLTGLEYLGDGRLLPVLEAFLTQARCYEVQAEELRTREQYANLVDEIMALD